MSSPAPEPKKATAAATRAKTAPKTCGVPGCENEAAAGVKLRIETLLEPASLYPAAVGGMFSACKPHRVCVGPKGYSPELTQGTSVFPSCGSPAKLFYEGYSFCEACHNVYLRCLLAQVRHKVTAEHIVTARRQMVTDADAAKPAAPVKAAAAAAADPPATTAVKATKAPSKSKKAAATAAAVVAPTTPPVVVVVKEESHVSEEEEEEVPVVAVKVAATVTPPPPPPVVVADEFEQLEAKMSVVPPVVAPPKAATTKTAGSGKKAAAAAAAKA